MKDRKLHCSQYNNDYNLANFQELKSMFNIIIVFNSYWNRVEQVRDNVMSKYCEVRNENFLEDMRNLFAAVISFVI